MVVAIRCSASASRHLPAGTTNHSRCRDSVIGSKTLTPRNFMWVLPERQFRAVRLAGGGDTKRGCTLCAKPGITEKSQFSAGVSGIHVAESSYMLLDRGTSVANTRRRARQRTLHATLGGGVRRSGANGIWVPGNAILARRFASPSVLSEPNLRCRNRST